MDMDMGLDKLSVAVRSMQKSLECSICLEQLSEPVKTRCCGNSFCHACISEVIRNPEASCPLCKKELKRRSVTLDEHSKTLVVKLQDLISAIERDSGINITKHVKKPHTTRECHTPHKYFMPPRTTRQQPNNANQPSTSRAHFEKPKKMDKSSKTNARRNQTNDDVTKKEDKSDNEQSSEKSSSEFLQRRSRNSVTERRKSLPQESETEETNDADKDIPEVVQASEKVKSWLRTSQFNKVPSTPGTPVKLPKEISSPVHSASLVPVSQIGRNPGWTKIDAEKLSEPETFTETKECDFLPDVPGSNVDDNQSSLFDGHVLPVKKTYKNMSLRKQNPNNFRYHANDSDTKAVGGNFKSGFSKQREISMKRKSAPVAESTKEDFGRIVNQHLEKQIKRIAATSATVTSSSSVKEDWTRLAEFRKELRPKTRKRKSLNISVESTVCAAKIPANKLQQKYAESDEEDRINSSDEKSHDAKLLLDVEEGSKIFGADKDRDQNFHEDTKEKSQLETVKQSCTVLNNDNIEVFAKPVISSYITSKEGERMHIEKLNKRQIEDVVGISLPKDISNDSKMTPMKRVVTASTLSLRKNRDNEKALSDESRNNSLTSPPLLSPAAGKGKLKKTANTSMESLDQSRASTISPPKLSPKLSTPMELVPSVQDQRESKIPRDSPRKLSQESIKSRLSLRKKGKHLKPTTEDFDSSNGSDALRKHHSELALNNASSNKSTTVFASKRSSITGDIVSFKKLGKIVQTKRKIKMLLLGPLAPKAKDLQATDNVGGSLSVSSRNVTQRRKQCYQKFPGLKLDVDVVYGSDSDEAQMSTNIADTSPTVSSIISLAKPIAPFTNSSTTNMLKTTHEISMLSPEKDSQLQHLSRTPPSHNGRSSSKPKPTSAGKNFSDYRRTMVMTSPRFKASASASDIEYQKEVHKLAYSLLGTDSEDADGTMHSSVGPIVEETLHEKKLPRISEKSSPSVKQHIRKESEEIRTGKIEVEQDVLSQELRSQTNRKKASDAARDIASFSKDTQSSQRSQMITSRRSEAGMEGLKKRRTSNSENEGIEDLNLEAKTLTVPLSGSERTKKSSVNLSLKNKVKTSENNRESSKKVVKYSKSNSSNSSMSQEETYGESLLRKSKRSKEKCCDELPSPDSFDQIDKTDGKSNKPTSMSVEDADELPVEINEVFPKTKSTLESSESSVVAKHKVVRKLHYSQDSEKSKKSEHTNTKSEALSKKNASYQSSSDFEAAERRPSATGLSDSSISNKLGRSSKRKRSESNFESDSEILESRSPSKVSPSKTGSFDKRVSLGAVAEYSTRNEIKIGTKRDHRSSSSDRDELEIIMPSGKTQLTVSQIKSQSSSDMQFLRNVMSSEDLSIAYTSSMTSQLPKKMRKTTDNSPDKDTNLQTNGSNLCDNPNQTSNLPARKSDAFSEKVFNEVKSFAEGIDSIWEEKIPLKEKKIVRSNPEPYNFGNESIRTTSSMDDEHLPALSNTAIYGTTKRSNSQKDVALVSKRRIHTSKYSDSQEAKDHVCDDILDAVKNIRNRSVNSNVLSPNMFSSSTATRSNSTRSKNDAKSMSNNPGGKISNDSPSDMFSTSSRSDSIKSKAGPDSAGKANGVDNLDQILANLNDVDCNDDIQKPQTLTHVVSASVDEPGKSMSEQSTQKLTNSSKESPARLTFPTDLNEDAESIGAENHAPDSTPENTRHARDSNINSDLENRHHISPGSITLVEKNSVDMIEKSPSPVKRRESRFRKVPEKVPGVTIKREADDFTTIPRKILQEIDDEWLKDKVENLQRTDELKLKKRLAQNVPISENTAPTSKERIKAEFKMDSEPFEAYSEQDSLLNITQDQLKFKHIEDRLLGAGKDTELQKRAEVHKLVEQPITDDEVRRSGAQRSSNTSVPFENSRDKTVVAANHQMGRESQESNNHQQENAGSDSDEDIVDSTPEKNVATKRDSQMFNLSAHRNLTSLNITPIPKVSENFCIATPVGSTATTIKLFSSEAKGNLERICAKNTPTTNRKLSVMYESTPKSSIINKNKSMVAKSHVERKSQLNLSSVSLNSRTSCKEPGAPKGEGRMCFVCSGLEPVKIEQVKAFARMVNAEYTSSYKSEVTHVIVKTDEETNAAGKTLKFLMGVAQRKWIVGFQWIADSMNQKKVLKEDKYEVVDNESLEPGPRRSRLRETDLFEGFAFYCVEPIADFSVEQYKVILESNGATVVRSLEALAAESEKLRVFTVQAEIHEHNIIGWYQKTKAVPVLHDWIVECITKYKQISLLSYLQELLPEDVLALGFPARLIEEDEDEEDEDENDTSCDNSRLRR